MTDTKNILALDVGGARIGVARGDTSMRIAVPLTTVLVDGTEYQQIENLCKDQSPLAALVIGYPRNQSGETTAQTELVESFAKKLCGLEVPVVFQDESLTSVLAEQRLKSSGSSYTKADIDAAAASIILQDYLEEKYGH